MRDGRKKIEFDYSLKTFKERLAFIENSDVLSHAIKEQEKINNRLLLNNSESKNMTSYNRYLESISTYLFRSEDITSERKIEHSFYRDNDKFLHKERNNLIFHLQESFSENGSYPNEMNECVQNIVYESIINDNVNNLLEKSNIDIEYVINKGEYDDRIKILRSIKDFNLSEFNIYIKDVLTSFLNELVKKCKDEIDAIIIDMTMDNYSIREISETVNLSQRTIKRRLKRIVER